MEAFAADVQAVVGSSELTWWTEDAERLAHEAELEREAGQAAELLTLLQCQCVGDVFKSMSLHVFQK